MSSLRCARSARCDSRYLQANRTPRDRIRDCCRSVRQRSQPVVRPPVLPRVLPTAAAQRGRQPPVPALGVQTAAAHSPVRRPTAAVQLLPPERAPGGLALAVQVLENSTAAGSSVRRGSRLRAMPENCARARSAQQARQRPGTSTPAALPQSGLPVRVRANGFASPSRCAYLFAVLPRPKWPASLHQPPPGSS